MLSRFLIAALFVISPLLVAQQNNPHNGTSKFVGASVCGTCHKSEKQGSQLGIWQESKHSKAFETLKTEKANKIAAELGHSTPAAETDACLACHASGYNVDAKFREAKFKIEDGVQCETCHGAGSEYKSLKIMKDKAAVIANGLIVHEKTENLCISCHNPESPTHTGFDFAASWEKIKHPVPGKEKK